MGNWKNIIEMENELTMNELYLLVEAMHRKEHRHNKFMAALQGVDIDEGKDEAKFEEIKQRALADLSGKTEEQYVFDMIGIEIEADDDD